MSDEQDAMIRLFFATARERYRMMLNYEAGRWPCVELGPTPVTAPHDRVGALTDDRIFQKYRFCNVFREDDKVTRWFKENIRSRMLSPEQHVRAAVAFRWFNLPESGELMLPWLLGDEPMSEAMYRIHDRATNRLPILNAAYMIKSPPGVKKAPGIFACMRNVEDDLETLTTSIVSMSTLEPAVQALCTCPYLGPFMAYQAVCDLRFTPVLENATDINTWTSPGPGSARGIGRIFYSNLKAFNYNSTVDRLELIRYMTYLLRRSQMENNLWPSEWPRWELSTVQHWACEFDKYMRVLNEEGEPKQKWHPAKTIA